MLYGWLQKLPFKINHEKSLAKYGIEYTNYHSTHSQENETLINEIYHDAQSAGYIYKKEIEQCFDEEKQMFLADRYVVGDCPKCSAKNQYGDGCEVCGATYSATDLVNPQSSLSKTVHASLALAIILFLGLFYQNDGFSFDRLFWSWIARYIHVVVGIMWIGLLWYFNFVQIPNMGKIPDEQKPAIGKVIAPAALFYFRWGAAFTILSGLILAGLNGYLHDAMTLSIGSNIPKHTAIGIGMWLGIVMAFNVWFVIWPNQKRALGIVECEPELKAKSARTAMLFSRTNTLLSIPMLLSMVAAQNLY